MTSEDLEDRLEFGRRFGAPPTAIALGRTHRDQRDPSLQRSAAAHVSWTASLARLRAEAWQQPTHPSATALLSHWSGGAIAFQSPLTSLAALRQHPRSALHLGDVDDGDWWSQPSADPLAGMLQPAAGAAAAAAVQEPEEQGEGHCPRNWRRAPPPLPLFPSGGLDMTPLLRSRMLQLLQQQEHEQQQLQQQQQQHPKRRQQRPAGIVYRGLLPPAALQQHAAAAHAPTDAGGDAGGPLARRMGGGTGAVTAAVTGAGGYRGSGGFPDACRPRDSSPPPTRGRSPDSAVDEEEELEDGPVSFVLRVQKDNKDGYCLSGLAGIRHFFPRQLRAATASRISQPVELWFRVPAPGGGKVLREYTLSVRVNKDRDRLNGILSRATALARDMDLCPGDTLTLSALSDGRPVAEPDEPVQPDAVRLTSAILCQSAWRIPMSMARHLLGDATASRPHQVIPVWLDGAQMPSPKGATLRSHVQTKGTSVRWSFLRLTVMLKAQGAVPGDTLRLGAVRSAAAVAGAAAPGAAAAAAATAAAAGPSSSQVPGSSTTVIAINVRLERAGSGAGQGTEATGTPPPLRQQPRQQQPKAAAESAVAEAVGPRAGEGAAAAAAAAHVPGSGPGKPATTAGTRGGSSDRFGSGSDIEGSADPYSSAGDSGDAGGSDISSDDGMSAAAAAAERRAGGEEPPAVVGSRWAVTHGRWAVTHGLAGAAAAGAPPPADEAAATGSVTDTLAPSARTGREAGAGRQPSGAAAAAKLTRQTAVAVDTAVTAAAVAVAGGQSGAPAAAQPPDVPVGHGNHPRVGGQGGAGHGDPGGVGRDRRRRRRDAEAESDPDDGPHRRRRREDSRSRRDNSSGVSGSGSGSGNQS